MPGEAESSDEEVRHEAKTVMKITLRNFHRSRQQTITLRFDQSIRGHANFFVPASDIPCLVSTTQDRPVWNLIKLDPKKDWGPLQFDFLVDGETIGGVNERYIKNWSDLRIQRQDDLIAFENQQVQQEHQQQAAGDAIPPYDQDAAYEFDGGAAATTPPVETDNFSGGGIKECAACTFHNAATALQCAICESNL